MKDHYIQAVLESIRDGQKPDTVMVSLKKVLNAKGHDRLLGSVLRGVMRVIEAQSDRSGSVVHVATEVEEKKLSSAIKAALKEMEADSAYTLKEDKTLVGGFVAEANNTVYDASYKTALINLYRKLTK